MLSQQHSHQQPFPTPVYGPVYSSSELPRPVYGPITTTTTTTPTIPATATSCAVYASAPSSTTTMGAPSLGPSYVVSPVIAGGIVGGGCGGGGMDYGTAAHHQRHSSSTPVYGAIGTPTSLATPPMTMGTSSSTTSSFAPCESPLTPTTAAIDNRHNAFGATSSGAFGGGGGSSLSQSFRRPNAAEGRNMSSSHHHSRHGKHHGSSNRQIAADGFFSPTATTTSGTIIPQQHQQQKAIDDNGNDDGSGKLTASSSSLSTSSSSSPSAGSSSFRQPRLGASMSVSGVVVGGSSSRTLLLNNPQQQAIHGTTLLATSGHSGRTSTSRLSVGASVFDHHHLAGPPNHHVGDGSISSAALVHITAAHPDRSGTPSAAADLPFGSSLASSPLQRPKKGSCVFGNRSSGGALQQRNVNTMLVRPNATMKVTATPTAVLPANNYLPATALTPPTVDCINTATGSAIDASPATPPTSFLYERAAAKASSRAASRASSQVTSPFQRGGGVGVGIVRRRMSADTTDGAHTDDGGVGSTNTTATVSPAMRATAAAPPFTQQQREDSTEEGDFVMKRRLSSDATAAAMLPPMAPPTMVPTTNTASTTTLLTTAIAATNNNNSFDVSVDDEVLGMTADGELIYGTRASHYHHHHNATTNSLPPPPLAATTTTANTSVLNISNMSVGSVVKPIPQRLPVYAAAASNAFNNTSLSAVVGVATTAMPATHAGIGGAVLLASPGSINVSAFSTVSALPIGIDLTAIGGMHVCGSGGDDDDDTTVDAEEEEGDYVTPPRDRGGKNVIVSEAPSAVKVSAEVATVNNADAHNTSASMSAAHLPITAAAVVGAAPAALSEVAGRPTGEDAEDDYGDEAHAARHFTASVYASVVPDALPYRTGAPPPSPRPLSFVVGIGGDDTTGYMSRSASVSSLSGHMMSGNRHRMSGVHSAAGVAVPATFSAAASLRASRVQSPLSASIASFAMPPPLPPPSSSSAAVAAMTTTSITSGRGKRTLSERSPSPNGTVAAAVVHQQHHQPVAPLSSCYNDYDYANTISVFDDEFEVDDTAALMMGSGNGVASFDNDCCFGSGPANGSTSGCYYPFSGNNMGVTRERLPTASFSHYRAPSTAYSGGGGSRASSAVSFDPVALEDAVLAAAVSVSGMGQNTAATTRPHSYAPPPPMLMPTATPTGGHGGHGYPPSRGGSVAFSASNTSVSSRAMSPAVQFMPPPPPLPLGRSVVGGSSSHQRPASAVVASTSAFPAPPGLQHPAAGSGVGRYGTRTEPNSRTQTPIGGVGSTTASAVHIRGLRTATITTNAHHSNTNTALVPTYTPPTPHELTLEAMRYRELLAAFDDKENNPDAHNVVGELQGIVLARQRRAQERLECDLLQRRWHLE